MTNTSESTHEESQGGKTNTKVGLFKSLAQSIRTKDITVSLLTLTDFQNIVSVLIGLRNEDHQCLRKCISSISALLRTQFASLLGLLDYCGCSNVTTAPISHGGKRVVIGRN